MLLEDNQPLQAVVHLESSRPRPGPPGSRGTPGTVPVPPGAASRGQAPVGSGRGEPAKRPVRTAPPGPARHPGRPAGRRRRSGSGDCSKWTRPTPRPATSSLPRSSSSGGIERPPRPWREFEQDKVLVDRANKLLQTRRAQPSRDREPCVRDRRRCCSRSGQERQGLYWLEQALARDPAHQAAHGALAEYFEKSGDKEQAAAHRRRLK